MTKMMSDDETYPLAKTFIVADKGTKWHLKCRRCDEAWSVTKGGLKAGNMLYLLNHAAGHDE